MRTHPRATGLRIAAAALAVAGLSAAPAHALRPVVFVHGGSGSGAQYETQAMRFASNGYPPSYIRVHEYDSTFSLNTTDQVLAGLDALIADVLAETGADQVDLLAHSLGTALMLNYLGNFPARAAKVAHYVNLDGAVANAPPGGVPTLAIWGRGNPARQIVGAENVYFPDQTHVQVVTSPESFAVQYEFLAGTPPVTTDILPEPNVRLGGRAVIFPQNRGLDDATLEIFEVEADTGARLRDDPDATYPLSSSAGGAFGPFEAAGGRHYELLVLRDGVRPHHFYYQPLVRSDFLIRLLTADPASPLSTNADSSDGTSGMVITRYCEFWGDQGADDDVLTINGFNIISPTNSPVTKRVNGIFVFDDNLDGVNNIVTPNAFYFALPFITAMDVFIPAADPPDGVVHIESTSRGGLTAAINVPNWASSRHIVSVILHPHIQPAAVHAPPDRRQLKCEAGTSKSLAKLVVAKAKCVRKCLDGQRRAGGPYADCAAPYGGVTAACIEDATRGAEAKARTRIAKACAKECPSCYDAGGNCPDGASFVAQVEDDADATGALVYCLEAAGATPGRPQAKCEDAVAKSLVKFAAAKSRCYDRCARQEFRQKLPPGSCTAGSPSDAGTEACLEEAESKAAAAIDDACEAPGAKPACYAPARDSGAEWAGVVENLVDAHTPRIYCSSSPSGAFLD